MRILYFSFVELDVPNACQTHTLGVLRGLSHNGCHIDALVPRPLKVRPLIPHVQFYYLWPWRFSKMGRIWIKLLSSLVMVFLCLRNCYDAIYVREMETNPGPRLLSRIFKIPLYIEINDLIVPVLSENKAKSSLVRKVRRQQKLDFKQSTGIIIPSVPMLDWVITQYKLPKDKVHLIINGTYEKISKKINSIDAKSKLGLPPGCFCLGFVGNIYERYDFNTILQAIVECKKHISDIYFVIIGEGPSIPYLKARINELGLRDRTILMGYIQSDKLSNILSAFDVGLLCLTKRDALRYGPITTKLSTYAMHKLPVVTAGLSLKGYPEELVQGLYLVPPENSYAIAKKILYIYNNLKEGSTKAKILHNYAIRKLTWKAISAEILKIIKNDIKFDKSYE